MRYPERSLNRIISDTPLKPEKEGKEIKKYKSESSEQRQQKNSLYLCNDYLVCS